jgi:hypothetical protein
MRQALEAIYEEALKLLQLDLSEQARRSADLILSLARYKFDVRSEDEKRSEDALEE